CRLGHDAELDLATQVEGSHDQHRDELVQVVVSALDELQVAEHRDDGAVIRHQRAQAIPQSASLFLLGVNQRDRLRVGTDMDQLKAKVGLLLQLEVVEPNEPASQEDDHGRAQQ